MDPSFEEDDWSNQQLSPSRQPIYHVRNNYTPTYIYTDDSNTRRSSLAVVEPIHDEQRYIASSPSTSSHSLRSRSYTMNKPMRTLSSLPSSTVIRNPVEQKGKPIASDSWLRRTTQSPLFIPIMVVGIGIIAFIIFSLLRRRRVSGESPTTPSVSTNTIDNTNDNPQLVASDSNTDNANNLQMNDNEMNMSSSSNNNNQQLNPAQPSLEKFLAGGEKDAPFGVVLPELPISIPKEGHSS